MESTDKFLRPLKATQCPPSISWGRLRRAASSSIRVQRAHTPHSPSPGQPTPGRHAAHTELPTKRATFTMCARGQARCACWLWLLVHRIQAVVVEAKGLPDGEPTAVRYNSSGLSGRDPHGSPRSDRDPLAGVGTLACFRVVSGTPSRTAFQMGAAGSRSERWPAAALAVGATAIGALAIQHSGARGG
jgi:hypothetical protein